MIERILAKVLFCRQQDLGNVLLHIPVGIAIGILGMTGHEILAFGAIYLFAKYQTIERRVINDACFPDIQGTLGGLIATGLLIAILKAI